MEINPFDFVGRGEVRYPPLRESVIAGGVVLGVLAAIYGIIRATIALVELDYEAFLQSPSVYVIAGALAVAILGSLAYYMDRKWPRTLGVIQILVAVFVGGYVAESLSIEGSVTVKLLTDGAVRAIGAVFLFGRGFIQTVSPGTVHRARGH